MCFHLVLGLASALSDLLSRNKSVGIVLGGGGAKGSAHLGVLRALEEHRIYPDFIAGTSIGALIGVLLAKHGSLEDATNKLRYCYWRLNSTLRMLLDLTLPSIAFLKAADSMVGKQFNQILQRVIPKDLNIEDLWIPYFCNVVDITKSRHLYIEHGSAWRAVRAAMGLAAMFPPVVDEEGNMLM
ncbi:phosphatidylcholine and lysophosphatidylcholine phospholipase, partial [Gonapodya sp. JEL0774]